MKKLIIKILVLLAIFFLIFHFNNLIFTKKSASINDWTQFYKSEQNQFDIIFIGSSIAYCSFDPKIVVDNTGLKSYNLSSSSISLEQVYYNTKEIIKYNKPQFLIIEAHSLDIETSNIGKRLKANFQNIDGQNLSINKLQSVLSVFDTKEQKLQALFPVIRNHNEWSNIDLLNENRAYRFVENKNLGYRPRANEGYEQRIKKTYGKPLEDYSISDNNKNYLNKIAELCKQNNMKLLLVRSPQIKYQKKKDYSKEIFNKTIELCRSLDIKYLDYNNQYQELGFQDLHFYDALHLNSKGANKLTEILLDDVTEMYNLNNNNRKKVNRESEYFINNGEYKNNMNLLTDTYKATEDINIEKVFIQNIEGDEYCIFVCFNKKVNLEKIYEYKVALQFYPEMDQIKHLETEKERESKKMSSGHLTKSIIETNEYYVLGISHYNIAPKKFKSFRIYLYNNENSTTPNKTTNISLNTY